VTEGFHPPLEEYLATIHDLMEEGTPVIQARIAERLGRSAPSVSEMLDRLEAGGYLARSGRRFQLTAEGAAIAERVVRKHRLAERLLVDVIGLEWHKVHVEAARWEHVISDDVEAKLVTLLGNPSSCPHGNPIPGGPRADVSPQQTLPLADVAPTSTIRLERISETVEFDRTSLELLDRHRFTPGASAFVRARDTDGAVTLELGGDSVVLSGPMCQHLFVTVAGR
jgi:DtxR family Mn-dependent transcriptional regulator